MKPKNNNHILRKIAIILAIVTGVASVAGSVASVICYQTGMYSNNSYQGILDQVYNQIQEHYEMSVIDNLDNPEFEGLDNTNLDYFIYKENDTSYKDSAGSDYYKDAKYFRQNDYTNNLYSTADFYAHTDGIIANLLYRNRIIEDANDESSDTFAVQSIVYNPTNGVFYYRTYNDTYYPVRKILVDARWGELRSGESGSGTSSLVYHLNEDANIYVCMHQNYAPLKTENYLDWIYASVDGCKIYTPYIDERNFEPESTHANSFFYDFTLNLDSDLASDELYVISDDIIPSSIKTSLGKYYLFPASPSIEVSKKNTNYLIVSHVASPLDTNKRDLFVQCTEVVDILYPYRTFILLGAFFMAGMFVLLVIYICRTTLQLRCEEEDGKGRPGRLARIPLLPFLIVTGGMLAFCIVSFVEVFNPWIYSTDSVLNRELALLSIIVIAGFAIVIMILLNICERIRTKTLLHNTILYHIIGWLKNQFKKLQGTMEHLKEFIIEHTTLFIGTVIVYGILSLSELFVIGVTEYHLTLEFCLFVIYKIPEAAFLFFCVSQFNHISKGSRQLAKGNLSNKLDTQRLFGVFKRHAEHLNQIGDGMQIAVQERLKSEHFKTELITNVTHDIKTPLTSIINYVDLLKQEGLTPEEHDQYLEVLDRQSARLKKLIEDLIEASKASTGNLTVEYETCNLDILLTQTLGEFEEKLLSNQLELIIRNSTNAGTKIKNDGTVAETSPISNDIVIEADSRHLWRIFDNLMNNICKYAQPNTRVYIDLEADTDEVRIIFRNTSRYQLDSDGDALLERFVRGDSSRSAEGNGLGLSIAKSLAELMKGHLSLSVDGDLFKVTITFPLYK
ncbi:MAG: HAMP domain-containing histidine kinase [Lachnospiraceae bacterium]|nr:HAMP domain-containing histidine kinase [Lachnospiraceae bacterium]